VARFEYTFILEEVERHRSAVELSRSPFRISWDRSRSHFIPAGGRRGFSLGLMLVIERAPRLWEVAIANRKGAAVWRTGRAPFTLDGPKDGKSNPEVLRNGDTVCFVSGAAEHRFSFEVPIMSHVVSSEASGVTASTTADAMFELAPDERTLLTALCIDHLCSRPGQLDMGEPTNDTLATMVAADDQYPRRGRAAPNAGNVEQRLKYLRSRINRECGAELDGNRALRVWAVHHVFEQLDLTMAKAMRELLERRGEVQR
jgi:hypothetical protein